MNKLVIAIVLLGVCSAANIKCTAQQKEAKFCTMEYMPVCGVKVDSKNKFVQSTTTYGNKCSACAEEGVEYYADGECNSYPSEVTFCHPDSYLNKACTREYFPVCGFSGDSFQTYSNKCSACINKEVSHFITGHCGEKWFH